MDACVDGGCIAWTAAWNRYDEVVVVVIVAVEDEVKLNVPIDPDPGGSATDNEGADATRLPLSDDWWWWSRCDEAEAEVPANGRAAYGFTAVVARAARLLPLAEAAPVRAFAVGTGA
jgi:hypothetical protein